MRARPKPSTPAAAPMEKRPIRLALKVNEACEALGISYETWRALVMPEVKVIRRGRLKLVAVAELQRWLDENGECIGDGP